ncbi:tetratricopeptide repeat protein [Breoghania sp.]|uniref:tetratricopeptide repeat protein n=1 Tax=Breoghania sp. TaxID=2065378 RepID=UPI002AA6FEA1|nr:tetratricopeptide repeat protein [Breoghania sp.]
MSAIQNFLTFIADNKEPLGMLGGALVTVTGAGWALFTHFKAAPNGEKAGGGGGGGDGARPASPPSAGGIVISGNNNQLVGGDGFVVVGDLSLTPKAGDLRTVLEQLLNERLEKGHEDGARQAELAVTREKLAHLDAARNDLQDKLDKAMQALAARDAQAAEAARHRNTIDAAERALMDQIKSGDAEQASEAALRLGELREATARLGEALEAYNLGLAHSPASSALREHAAAAAKRIGAYEEAEIHLKSLVQMARKDAENLDGLAEEGFDANLIRNFSLGLALEKLGDFYVFLGRCDDAVATYREVLSFVESDEERAAPEARAAPRVEGLRAKIATARNTGPQARADENEGELDALRRELASEAGRGGEKSLRWAAAANNLAEALRSHGRLGEAATLYEQAREIFDLKCEPGAEEPALIRINQSALMVREGKHAAAENLLEEAFARLGDTHPLPVTVLFNTGMSCLKTGAPEYAMKFFRKAIARAQAIHKPGDAVLPKLWAALAEAARHAGDESARREARDKVRQFLSTEHFDEEAAAELRRLDEQDCYAIMRDLFSAAAKGKPADD